MFDPIQRYLYWMLVDILPEALITGEYNETPLIAPYIPPIPKNPGECASIVFILFKQSKGNQMIEYYNNDHVLRSHFCIDHCIYRFILFKIKKNIFIYLNKNLLINF